GLWFTQDRTNQIGGFDPRSTGSAEIFDLPSAGHPARLAGGADGNVWFADSGWIGRIATGLASPASGNLLGNPGFEEGTATADKQGRVPIPEWATTATMTAAPYGAGGFPATEFANGFGGGANLAWGGPGSTVSHAFQYVDLSSDRAAIDTRRAAATLSGELGGLRRSAGDLP